MFILQLLSTLFLSIGSYSINTFPNPLDKNEEEKLINEMLIGNKDARAKLIEHNLRLVAHIVKKFEKFDNNQDDLISIGTIGLIKGIDSYKLDKKSKLTTYVAKCISNEILMYFRQNKKRNNDVSLNDVIGTDSEGNEICLMDIIKNNEEEITNTLHSKENNMLVNKYLNILSEREKEIIIKRYGLFDSKEYTQKEISKLLHISRSYVSRIEKKALSKLYLKFIAEKKEI